VRARNEEEQRAGFANPEGLACFTPLQIRCAQEPDGLFGTMAFFALNEDALPAVPPIPGAARHGLRVKVVVIY
jgi:hypothetical protein